MNAAGGCSASLVVITMSACWLTNQALALIPPGTGQGGRIIVWDAMVRNHCKCCFSVVGRHSSGRTNVGATRQIVRTSPGVLFRVCC